MLLRLTALGLAALALPVATGCGDDDEPPADDAGIDAGRDLGRDLGTDGGPADLGSDAADTDGGPSDPEWVPLPDLPLGCRVERALHPERLFVPKWSSCGEGCLFLEQDAVFELRPTHVGGTDRRSADGTSYVFTVLGRQSEDSRTRRQIVTLVGTDGSVPVAYRTPNPRETPLCAIGSIPYSDGWAGFTITMRDGSESLDYDAVFHAPLEELKHAERPTRLLGPDDIPGYGNVLQQAYVSPVAVAFQVQPLGEVWVVEDGSWRRLGGSESAVPGSPQGVALVGGHALWNEWRTDVRIAHGSLDQAAEPYFGVEGARVIFATDGVDLAWVQGYGWDGSGGFDRMELWSAPYVREPGELAPRRSLESYTGSTLGVVGGGAWTTLVERGGRRGIQILDLSTGSSTVIWAPVDMLLTQRPSWIGADTVGTVARQGGLDTFDTFLLLHRDAAVPVE